MLVYGSGCSESGAVCLGLNCEGLGLFRALDALPELLVSDCRRYCSNIDGSSRCFHMEGAAETVALVGADQLQAW